MATFYRSGFIPRGVDLGHIEWLEHPSSPVLLPHLTAAQITTLSHYITEQAQHVKIKIADIVVAIDQCIHLMLDESQTERQQIEQLLYLHTGFDPEMIRRGLNNCLKTFRAPQLWRAVNEDFPNPNLLDDFSPRIFGGWSRAFGAAPLAAVWAGNVPGIPIWTICAALLTKSSLLGKLATAEPLVASWFTQSLALVAPELAERLAIIWWPGGETTSEQCVANLADVLMIYGGEKTVNAWKSYCPASTRFIAHGHKFSAAFIGAEALDRFQAQQTAQRLALDIAQWNQQACYAPQTVYIEKNGLISPSEFATLVAGELQALSFRYPQQQLSLSQKQQIASWYSVHQQRLFTGQAMQLHHHAANEWSVVYYDEHHKPEPSPTFRNISLIAVNNAQDMFNQLRPYQAYLQTLAIAVDPQRLFTLSSLAGSIGIHRICAVGATFTPPSGWHHDGRFSLLDLIRLVDIEPSSEMLAEELTYYRD